MAFILAVVISIVQCFSCLAQSKQEVVLLAHKEPAVTGNGPIGNLVVAKTRIRKGTVLQLADIEITQCDEWKIPVNVYRSPSDVVGRIAKYDINKGSALGDMSLLSNPDRILQISINQKLFAKLQAEATRHRVTDSIMAKILLEKQLGALESTSKH